MGVSSETFELRRYCLGRGAETHRVCFMLELGLHFSSAMNSVCGLQFSISYLAGQLPCCSPLLLSPFQRVYHRKYSGGLRKHRISQSPAGVAISFAAFQLLYDNGLCISFF
ncbi:hypothetical protein F2Q69_00049591 [Brassica cretica]|uniref:Uncharacterized protein n=1 Tax=Brassica cretica TaxID=69181 RepID=A0A8S9PJY2_BRACR|nr:hypothetical protein F2Q69_00049591 [Brassica cretica]